MKNWPLRRRIAVWAAISTGLVLIVFCLGTLASLYVEQVRGVDEELTRDGGFSRRRPLETIRQGPRWRLPLPPVPGSKLAFLIETGHS